MMRAKPRVIALCDDPRLLRALARQTRDWVELSEADRSERVMQHLGVHPSAAVLLTEPMLRTLEGQRIARDIRVRFPEARLCLLATYVDLALVSRAIHEGWVDALVHVPLTRGQFLAAVVGERTMACAA